MNNQVYTLIKDATVISDEKSEVLDLGMYSRLHVQVSIKIAANASQELQFQHAAINEDAAFGTLGSAVSIAATGNQVLEVTNFLRYIRFVASSSISTQPTLSVYIVAKEN